MKFFHVLSHGKTILHSKTNRKSIAEVLEVAFRFPREIELLGMNKNLHGSKTILKSQWMAFYFRITEMKMLPMQAEISQNGGNRMSRNKKEEEFS